MCAADEWETSRFRFPVSRRLPVLDRCLVLAAWVVNLLHSYAAEGVGLVFLYFSPPPPDDRAQRPSSFPPILLRSEIGEALFPPLPHTAGDYFRGQFPTNLFSCLNTFRLLLLSSSVFSFFSSFIRLKMSSFVSVIAALAA